MSTTRTHIYKRIVSNSNSNIDWLTATTDFPTLTFDQDLSCLNVGTMDYETLYFEGDQKPKVSFEDNNGTTPGHGLVDLDPNFEESFDLQQLIEASNITVIGGNSTLFPDLLPEAETSLEKSVVEQSSHLSQMPQIIPLNFGEGVTNIKTEPGTFEVPLEGFLGVIESASQSESFPTVQVAEIKPLTAGSSTSGERRPAPGKQPRKGRKRSLDKESEEYKARRERNNVAVRKSRDKSKKHHTETEQRVKILTAENDQLNKKCDLLTKELNVLKGLFANVGANLPKEFKEFIANS